MEKLHFSTTIDAPKQKVWDTMFQDSTYREWTSAFNPKGSWFEGDWSEGSRIRFLGPGEDGRLGGMVSQIKINRPLEHMSIQHLGVIQDGKEDTTSAAVKAWAPAFENYTFREKDGRTEVLIDMDIDEEHRTMFEGMWPKALAKLKELAEQ
ncbi:MAG: SRPBCC domain-containing protein [Vicinamibacterales bacterium]